MSFALHPQLLKDSVLVGELALCQIRLINNKHFPWLILVPMRENLRELFDLTADDYAVAMDEVRVVAEQFSSITKAHKMNVAMLGNQVPQLHIHVVARFTHDAAWPNPVWNTGVKPETYPSGQLASLTNAIRTALGIE